MGTLPPGLVAGNYFPVYEAYYQQVDPLNKGSVGAIEAAKFLKTSGLSDIVLSKIWDLADSNSKGYLTKSGFFIALKLVALVQAGKEPTTANLSLDIPPPKMGECDKTNKMSVVSTTVGSDWTMKPTEKMKYDQLFDSLNPANGVIPGAKVKGLLMDSKLPVTTLCKIWDLADMDKDGALDRHEFCVAMHLVYKALEKYTIPSCLPPELIPPGKRKESLSLASSVQVLPAVPNGVRSETPVLKPLTPPITQPMTTTPSVQPILPIVQSVSSTPSVSPIPSYSFSHPVTNPSSVPSLISQPLIPPPTSQPLIPPVTSQPLIPPISSTTPLIQPLNTTGTPVSSVTSPLIPVTSDLILKPVTPVPVTVAPVQSTPVPSPMFPADNLLSPLEEPWVITKEEKKKYDMLFEQADLDRDGFVSGHEIKDTFLKSGVAQPVLAHIWSLCDTAEQGKLNNEQFALALWLISRKLKGIDPPRKLTPEMVPPSCRKPVADTPSNETSIFSSPEVDRLTKEIDELVKEKLSLEANITQREADIKIKAGEIKSLQSELDALVATLKQLENQKGEAVKRINDLKTQKSELESKIKEVDNEIEVEQEEVNKLRHQAEEQERNLKTQEAELNKKKQELESLKQEEKNLKKERDKLKEEIEEVTHQSTEMTELINEIRAKLIELDDFQLQLKEAISHLDNVLESKNVTSLSESYLNIEPKFQNESCTSLFDKILKITNPSTNVDPFSDMNNQNNIDADFSKTDAFKNDPFDSKDPFSSVFNYNKTNTEFTTDPFASFDTKVVDKKADPFADNSTAKVSTQKEDDPFGCDPFAILHAPPRPGTTSNIPSPLAPRSESPSPALPPKKCKQPPPRPAPPRPAPPAMSSGFDADFADFSGFSHKVTGHSGVKRDPLPTPELKNDPFRDYRYDDPFEIVDEVDVPRGASAPPLMDSKSAAFDPVFKNDPFATVTAGSNKPVTNGLSKSTIPLNGSLPSENQQIAWATAESVKSEKERRKRAEQQEKADFKLALKLSKSDGKKRSYKPKVFS